MLSGKTEFKYYKLKLDVEGAYDHLHHNEPEKYPCKVVSNFWDDPNGPYTYHHEFYYKKKISCKECGYTEEEWPEIKEEA